MYNTIGGLSANLADKLFNTINRRHELKAQGKLAELQANLAREERQFGAETQRLRDRDYQKFQERMREDQQLHQKTERISRQTFQSVESRKASLRQALQNKAQSELDFQHDLLLQKQKRAEVMYQNARTKAEQDKALQDLQDVTNEISQLPQIKGLKDTRDRGFISTLSTGGTIPAKFAQLPKETVNTRVREYMSKQPYDEFGNPMTLEKAKGRILEQYKAQDMTLPSQAQAAFGMPTTYGAGQTTDLNYMRRAKQALTGWTQDDPQYQQNPLIPRLQTSDQQYTDPYGNMRRVTAESPQFDLGGLQNYENAYRRVSDRSYFDLLQELEGVQ